ncbi:MAG: hypothetical protein CMP25_03080 [Rickettsiales bacterium]|nr:hypothetical protein [Rickettsiales bacterium]
MIKPLKIIVITLGLLIIIASTIIIIALFDKFKKKQIETSDKTTIYLNVNKDHIVSSSVEDKYLYIHLKDENGDQKIKVFDINNSNLTKEIYLNK